MSPHWLGGGLATDHHIRVGYIGILCFIRLIQGTDANCARVDVAHLEFLLIAN